MASPGSVQECWYGVSDPRKRKQIQDRLAQRARRRRLASQRDSTEDQQQPYTMNWNASDSNESFQQDDLPSSRSQGTLITEDQTVPETQPILWSSTSIESSEPTSPSSLDDLYTAIPAAAFEMVPAPVDQCAFPRPQLSMFAALWDNGAMMGISCCCGFTAKSKPTGPEIPPSLRPTPLQLAKLHLTWIDRFPFPRMRDNMISLSGVFDEEDFLEDLFKQYSFILIPGGLSYDPGAWRIGKEFAFKWGYLFY